MSSLYSSIIKNSAKRIVYVLEFVFYEIWWYDATDKDNTGEVVEYEWNYLFRDKDGIENRSVDFETVQEYISLAKELGTPARVWCAEDVVNG